MHFIATGSSWLNMVERWFREITQRRIRRGTFRNVKDLVVAITAYLGPRRHQRPAHHHASRIIQVRN